jgi:hypothetical protein
MNPQNLARREDLAAMLTELIHDTHNESLRIKAAKLGLKIAMEEGDASSSLLSESLTADFPKETGPRAIASLGHLSATAKATRKAIELASNSAAPFNRSQVNHNLRNPNTVLQEIQDRIQTGHLHLARSIVHVGLSRHPQHPGLHAARSDLGTLIEQRGHVKTLPIPIRLSPNES